MAPSEVLLLNHIRLVHSCDPNFSIQCSFPGCSRTFKNFRTYQNHRCYHRHQHVEECSTYGSDDFESEIETELCMTPAVQLPDLQTYAAQWILKTRESRYLTRAATQGVIEDVQDLLSVISQSMETQTRAVLCESGIDFDSVPNLERVFSGPATKPFEGVSSFHQQMQYYRKHFNLVVSILHFCVFRQFILKYLLKEPRRIVLKETRVHQRSGRKRKIVVKKEEMMYIPLLETLQGLLNNSSIMSQVTQKFLLCMKVNCVYHVHVGSKLPPEKLS